MQEKYRIGKRRAFRLFALILGGLSVTLFSCQNLAKKEVDEAAMRDRHLRGVVNHESHRPFDSIFIDTFFTRYPLLEKYRTDVKEIYRQHQFTEIWYDESGIVEFGHTIFSRSKDLSDEGLSILFPYQEQVDGIFENDKENLLTETETDLMVTSLYLFYAGSVYKGVSDSTTTAIGWLLPRKQLEFASLLDSLLNDPRILVRNDSIMFAQYYKLKDILRKYREIEKNGGWDPIDADPNRKSFKPGDTSVTIQQIRERLFMTGDLEKDSKSSLYDAELADAVKRYQLRNGKHASEKILPEHIEEMNVPISERIRQIIVNMERCRWIPPEFARSSEFIVVNIPSFRLNVYRDGKNIFESPVVVGKSMNKTVIFSGMMSYIVFSPYWNVPQSIINKEVKPGMAKNKNYLEAHHMEWNNGQVRQKPGKNNSLGQVKFIFPNSNDIYLHDTPAKSLFNKESRAYSHGCIRVGKPRDLAVTILAEDPDWSPSRIDAAMNSGKETTCVLKKKIPVYIGYFTAWVDEKGVINFYDDVYERDDPLTALLLGSK